MTGCKIPGPLCVNDSEPIDKGTRQPKSEGAPSFAHLAKDGIHPSPDHTHPSSQAHPEFLLKGTLTKQEQANKSCQPTNANSIRPLPQSPNAVG
jgi:hypothetical protein